jgi:phosphoribosylanthranilate isomerase
MVHVKICGITNLEDAMASVEAGASMLGFNFYRRSPRYLEPLAAGRIVEKLPRGIMCVGVFVNEPKEEVERIAREAHLSAVQLHGDESPTYCRDLKKFFVIKALRVSHDFQPEQAALYETDAVLLDGFTDQAYGGTGRGFDWSIGMRTRLLVEKLFLAGGLDPTSVATAIASVQPYAVDVCSSLESLPGRKDHGLLRAFIRAAQMGNEVPFLPMSKGLKA